MNASDIILLGIMLLGAAAVGLYFLNRWASRRMSDQQDMIERTKMTVSIYVIDKKKDKPANANLPKAVSEQLPKIYRFMKMPLVKAKVGPQIVTLMCDKQVFEALPIKKNVKVDLAGIYIVGMKGMKSKKEMKERKNQKAALVEKQEKWYDKMNPAKLFKK